MSRTTSRFDRPMIMMCPPDFYGIEYEINPWMSRSRASDPAGSRRQWQALHDLLVSLGAEIHLQAPVRGLPDLVFTANAGLVWGETVFLSRFRHAARQGETPHDDAFFRAAGFRTLMLPDGRSGAVDEAAPDEGPGIEAMRGGEIRTSDTEAVPSSPPPAHSSSATSPDEVHARGSASPGDTRLHFEGAGDALFCGETLYGGYLIRSEARALQWVAGEIGCPLILLQLVDEFYYHLDTCFCPLAPGEAIYYPAAFDNYALRALRRSVDRLIRVEPEEAARFACNAVVLGRNVVLNTGCPKLEGALRDRGYTPHATPLDEFIKAGGSAKCLTLRLDGEDAARWPPAADRTVR